jgi:hypothetical protein
MSRAGNVKLSQNPKLGLVVLVLNKGGHRSPFGGSEFGVRGSGHGTGVLVLVLVREIAECKVVTQPYS